MTRWHGILATAAALVAVCVFTDFAQAQRGQGPGGGRQAGGRQAGGRPGGMTGGFGGRMGGFGGSSDMQLLRRKDVQKELEMLGDQVKDLEKLTEDQRNAMRDMFSQMRNMSQEERTQKLRSAMEGTQRKVNEILLPHQTERLKQLALQYRMRGGLAALLRDANLTKEVGISDADKQKLEAKSRALEEELRKKVAELRKQAQQQLMKELSPQQQAQIKKLIGTPFEFQNEAPAAGGPGGRAGSGGGAFGGRPQGRTGRPSRGG